MNVVFVDTIGVLALLDVRDQWRTVAAAAWAYVLADEANFRTTSLVLVECANAAARRPYRAAVAELRDSLAAAGSVIEPSHAEWELAWRSYAHGRERWRGEVMRTAASAGVVDHLSFLVMRRYSLTRAFTNDRHFLAAGIEVLF